MFAYRLVSGHWRVQTGVSRIGEGGTVTTAGVFGLNVNFVRIGYEFRANLCEFLLIACESQ